MEKAVELAGETAAKSAEFGESHSKKSAEFEEELAKATRALSAGKSATGKPTKRPASSTLDAEWIGKTLELGQEKGSSKVG